MPWVIHSAAMRPSGSSDGSPVRFSKEATTTRFGSSCVAAGAGAFPDGARASVLARSPPFQSQSPAEPARRRAPAPKATTTRRRAAENRTVGDGRSRTGGGEARGRRAGRELLPGGEVAGEVARGVVPVAGLLGEAALHQRDERGRKALDVRRERRRLFHEDRGEDVGAGLAPERPPPREQLGEGDAEGELVGPVVHAQTAGLLGGHVGGGADDGAGLGAL